MNKLLFLAFTFVILCFTSLAEVPASVTKSFNAKYPRAAQVTWEQNGSEYKAAFKTGGKDLVAVFNADGSWIETSFAIPVTEVPVMITDVAKKQLPGQTISSAQKVEHSVHGECYRLKTNAPESVLLISRNGSLL